MRSRFNKISEFKFRILNPTVERIECVELAADTYSR